MNSNLVVIVLDRLALGLGHSKFQNIDGKDLILTLNPVVLKLNTLIPVVLQNGVVIGLSNNARKK